MLAHVRGAFALIQGWRSSAFGSACANVVRKQGHHPRQASGAEAHTMKRTSRSIAVALALALAALLSQWTLIRAQSGFDDDRVLLQGFYWESYRHGHADYSHYGTRRWY